MFLYGDVRVRDRVRDRDLLLTYMYTLNFLNNYFIAILTTAIIYLSAIPTACAPSTAGSAAAV
jgi:hypothetical protein